MLCTKPGSSELRTRLISAALGRLEVCPNVGTEWTRPDPVDTAYSLFELRVSQRSGSGLCFSRVSEAGRRTWYGLETDCGIVIWTT